MYMKHEKILNFREIGYKLVTVGYSHKEIIVKRDNTVARFLIAIFVVFKALISIELCKAFIIKLKTT